MYYIYKKERLYTSYTYCYQETTATPLTKPSSNDDSGIGNDFDFEVKVSL